LNKNYNIWTSKGENMFAQERIKMVAPRGMDCGIEEFLDRSTELKLRYFKGKIQIGNGPQM